jgi:anti-sigma factor RsiW
MEHLTSEQLGAYLANTLDPLERANVERHLVVCSDCRRELVEAHRAISTAPDVRRTKAGWYGVAGLAAAAAVLLVIWPREQFRPASTAIERNAPAVAAAGALTIVSPIPSGELDSSTRSFTWNRNDDASYRITITDSAGRSIWSGNTQDTTIAVPASVQLERGARFFWYVDALRADGRSVTSGINTFYAPRR